MLDRLCDYVRSMESAVERAQGQDLRMNLVFTGIPESAKEDWQTSETVIRRLWSEKMNITDANSIKIQRCHRMGAYDVSAAKPRRMVVKFAFYGDRDRVLSNRALLKGTNIYVDEQFSERVRKIRSILYNNFKADKLKGSKVVLSFDKIRVDGNIYEFDPIQQAVIPFRRAVKNYGGGIDTFLKVTEVINREPNVPVISQNKTQSKNNLNSYSDAVSYDLMMRGQRNDGDIRLEKDDSIFPGSATNGLRSPIQ